MAMTSRSSDPFLAYKRRVSARFEALQTSITVLHSSYLSLNAIITESVTKFATLLTQTVGRFGELVRAQELDIRNLELSVDQRLSDMHQKLLEIEVRLERLTADRTPVNLDN